MIWKFIQYCEWNPPLTGGFPHNGPVMQSFDASLMWHGTKLLNKQSSYRKFVEHGIETLYIPSSRCCDHMMAQSNTEILQSSTKKSDVHYSDITCELWCFKSLATHSYLHNSLWWLMTKTLKMHISMRGIHWLPPRMDSPLKLPEINMERYSPVWKGRMFTSVQHYVENIYHQRIPSNL